MNIFTPRGKPGSIHTVLRNSSHRRRKVSPLSNPRSEALRASSRHAGTRWRRPKTTLGAVMASFLATTRMAHFIENQPPGHRGPVVAFVAMTAHIVGSGHLRAVAICRERKLHAPDVGWNIGCASRRSCEWTYSHRGGTPGPFTLFFTTLHTVTTKCHHCQIRDR